MIKDDEIPIGYKIVKNAAIRPLESGGTILFSVPKETLRKGLAIFVGFTYEWEILGESAGDLSINHEVPFWSTNLPATFIK